MNNKKENIANFIKLFLLVYMMVNGFFITYSFVWAAFGLPITKWALALLYALAGLSEYGYYRWIREG